MSRVNYAFDPVAAQAPAAPPLGIRAHLPTKEKMQDRRYLKMAMETIGLFLFGFGTASLVMHLAAGFFLVSRFAAFLPHMQS